MLVLPNRDKFLRCCEHYHTTRASKIIPSKPYSAKPVLAKGLTQERKTIAAIKEFADRTCVEAEKVYAIFLALIDAWTEQRGWCEELRSINPDLYDSDLFIKLRKTLGPHLDKLVIKEEGDLSKGDSP
jgi:hypothetical protein